jgi:hypothetical protein
MKRYDLSIRSIVLSALILGQLAAPGPQATALGSSSSPTPTATASEAPATDHQVGLADVDVRRDPETKEINSARALKASRGTPSPAIAALRADAPGKASDVRVELHPSGFLREVAGIGSLLTKPAKGAPKLIARQFLLKNADLFGLTKAGVRQLKVTMEHLDEASGVTFLKYEQRVGDVPVFDSEISVSVTAQGEVVMATAGHLVQQPDVAPDVALTEDDAIAKAFEHCGATIPMARLEARVETDETGMAAYANPIDASLEDVLAARTLVNVHGEARVAYDVFVDKGGAEWYETLVDATTGELLYRRNLYCDASGLIFKQNPTRAPRTLETFAPEAFNPPPPQDLWFTGEISKGNNVDAYLDTDADNKPDALTNRDLRDGRALAPTGDFSYPFQTGVDPRGFRPASVANLFYHVNYMHDWMYSLGFTESARNFQLDNYARGGKNRDFVKAEAQDGKGMNNANMATPPDGKSPRMQMYLWGRAGNPSGDRDSALDGDVVFHEYGHGVSHRLVGNARGLGGTQSDAMGEGWSDYWAVTAFNDPIVGEYSNGSSSGIRRTAYDGRTTAPNGDYAMLGSGGFQVHNDGEIWCQTLVDLRNTLGAAYTDRLVLAGMMHTAVHPSMISGRNGILAADQALTGGANQCEIWRVFARHGMGFSANGNDGTTHNAAYDLPRDCSHSPSDNAQIYTTDGAGGISALYGYGDFRSSWSIIVAGNFGGDSAPDLLFYDPAGVGEFYSTDGEGHIVHMSTHDLWDPGWDIIVPGNFGGDGHTDLLFYDRERGVGAFYATDGNGGIVPLAVHDSFRSSWDIILPGEFGGGGHTDLFFYDRAAGTGEFYATDGGGGIAHLATHDYFRTSWDIILPGSFGGGSHTDLFFYDRAAGTGEFYMTDGAGGIVHLQTHDYFRPSWDIIVPGEFGGSGYTDLLFYDRAAGTGEFYATDGWGNIGLLKSHFDWRGTWALIVPANFGDNAYTDLLFYQR